MKGVLKELGGGDRRSIGRSEEVAKAVLSNASKFADVFSGMLGEDRLIRMRSADAVEKVTAIRPELLQPYKSQLLRLVSTCPDKEVRWHVAQMLPRLTLTSAEEKRAVEILVEYLDDDSRIVKTFSMQALADLALRNRQLLPLVIPIVERCTHSGSPAMTSRGRKLLKKLWRIAEA
ncbi:MAG TPA: hypothetical protein VGV35_17470 [Bryobacteraceae bacterium]|nr:hypothetical protein [Bryobacteraceae bacterium]